MKKLEAIIRHYKLDDVRHALLKAGVQGMTITEVRGWGHEKPCAETYRGVDHDVAYVSRVKVEVVVDEDQAAPAIDAILAAAYTGRHGDGRIFVMNLENIVRIRTGEQQVLALS